MRKFVITILFIIIYMALNPQVKAIDNVQDRVSVVYNKTAAMAQPAKPAKPAQLRENKPLMYPNAKNGYRTGYSRPQTRFAHLNKRFSKPQTRFAHKRPEYIYTKEYQNNVINRHSPGMKKNNTKTVKPAVVIDNKKISTNKIIACSGITYYGIQNSCK